MKTAKVKKIIRKRLTTTIDQQFAANLKRKLTRNSSKLEGQARRANTIEFEESNSASSLSERQHPGTIGSSKANGNDCSEDNTKGEVRLATLEDLHAVLGYAVGGGDEQPDHLLIKDQESFEDMCDQVLHDHKSDATGRAPRSQRALHADGSKATNIFAQLENQNQLSPRPSPRTEFFRFSYRDQISSIHKSEDPDDDGELRIQFVREQDAKSPPRFKE